MKHVCISLAAALALAVPSFAQSTEETPFSCEVRVKFNQAGTSYSSVAEAVAAVPTDGKIHYVYVVGEGPAEITTPITVKAGQNISLCSEKNAITYNIPTSLTAPVFTVESGAHLTFTRNGKYVYGEGVQGTFLENYGYVSLAMGTFTLDAGDSGVAIINHGGAEDNSMKCGATVTVASGTAFRNDGVLTISSGTTTAESGIAVLSNGGTLTLSTSKSVIGSEGAIVVNGGVAKFTKGSYASTSAAPAVRLCAAAAPIEAVFSSPSVTLTAAEGDALVVDGSAQVCKVQINKGTFTPAEGKASVRVTHDTENADVTLSVVDGVFNAPIVSEGSAPIVGFILGGTFAAQPDPSLVADGLTFEQNADGLYAPTAVAQIGDTTYLTFKEAIVAATPGATVTLLRDVTIPESTPITVYGLTIDLAGHTLTNTAANGSGIRLTLSNAEGTPADFTLVGPGAIVADTPIYASGAYNYARPYAVVVDEDIRLTSTVEGNPLIELSGSARMAFTETNLKRLGQGGFKVNDGDAEWLYGNCAGAFLNTPEGGTFTLCQDFKGSSRLEFPIDPTLLQTRATGIVKSATLDLAGHAFTSTLDGNSADLIVIDSGADVTIKGGSLTAIGDLAHMALPEDNNGNAALTLEDVTATSSSDDYLIVSNGSTDNINITVRDSTLTATGANTVAIFAPAGGDSTVTLDNAIIKSPYGVQVCAGDLFVKGNTRITTTAANVASTKTGDGPIPDGAAISIVDRAGYGDDATTGSSIGTVTIEGTPTLIAQGKGATAVAAYTWSDNAQSDWDDASKHVAISGGTFSQKPDDALLAPDFVLVENQDGTFGVASAYVASIGDVKYATLEEAFGAVAVDGTKTTITVLTDMEITKALTVPEGAKLTLNLDGHTLTAPETLTDPVITNKGSSLTLQTNSKPSAIIAAGGMVIYNYAGTLAGATPATKGKYLTLRTTASNSMAVFSGGGSVKLSGMTDSLIQGTAGAVGIGGGELSVSSALTLDGGNGPAVALSPMNAAVIFKTSRTGATFTSAGTEAILIEGTSPSDGRTITAEVKSGTFTGTGAETVGLRVKRDKGGTVDLTIDNGTVAFLKPIVAEGTDPVTGVVASASFAADALPGETLLADSVAATYPASALEGGITYDDFSGAVRNGSNGKLQEVTLIKDATGEAGGTLSQGRIVSVDLNGHSVAFAEGKGLTVDRASLTIEGEGSLNASGNVAVITMKGSKTDVAEDCATLVVGEQVTLKGQAGVLVTPNGNAAYGVDVVVNGKIEAVDSGINVNGSINVTEGNVPTITLAETSAVTATAVDSVGIYAGGYAIWNLKGDIRAADALSIKCGDITVSDGDYVAFGTLSVPPTAATSGSENTGSAVSITTIPNSVYATKTKVTITGGTFTSENGYALYEGVAQGVQTDSTAVDLSITGGTFTGKEGLDADVAVTTASDKQVISGGTFNTSLPEDLLAPGFVYVPQGDGTFGVIEGTYVAQIGEVKYASLQEAFDAATGTDTITLLSTVTDTPRLMLDDGRHVTVDLAGNNIGFAQDGYFALRHGTLDLIGSGKVYEQAPYNAPVKIWGAREDVADYSVVTVGEGVTLEGWAGIFITVHQDEANHNLPEAYGVKVTMAGTANSVKDTTGAVGHGVYINGSIQKIEGNVPQITLTETSKVTSIGNGIYAAGYAHWTLAGDVSGADALSIKSGTFTITGGNYRGTGSFADPAEAHGNGSENTGAAVTITTNDGYAQAPIVMDISGTPTFTSENGYAFYEGIAKKADGTPAATASRAVIAIKGGDFTGSKTNEAVTADIAVTTAENKQVVSGGTFSKPVELAYCAPGYIPVVGTDGKYTVDGMAVAAVANPEAQGTYLGYGTLAALVEATANGTEVLIVKYEALGEEVNLLKTATGGDNAASGATAYDVAETLGGTFKVQDGAIVYAYQLGIADLDVSESGISVTVRLEEDGTAVTRTLEGRKVRVVSDKKVLAETDAVFTDGACALTVPKADLPTGNLALTVSVAPAVETPAE